LKELQELKDYKEDHDGLDNMLTEKLNLNSPQELETTNLRNLGPVSVQQAERNQIASLENSHIIQPEIRPQNLGQQIIEEISHRESAQGPTSIEIESDKNDSRINLEKLQEQSETLKEQKLFAQQYEQKKSTISTFIKNNPVEDVPIDILIQFCISSVVEEQVLLVTCSSSYFKFRPIMS
jgi:hypothetical protein